jgi:hypothetical protein
MEMVEIENDWTIQSILDKITKLPDYNPNGWYNEKGERLSPDEEEKMKKRAELIRKEARERESLDRVKSTNNIQ